MSKVINTVEEMQMEIDAMANAVVRNVAQILTEKLKEFIEDDVYSYPETWGGRTGDFKDSWVYSEPTIINGFIESIISEDLAMIPFDGEWSHGSNYGTIFEEYNLAEIINNGLTTSNFNFPPIQQRPFWDDWVKWATVNFDRLFIEECAKYNGITMRASITFR